MDIAATLNEITALSVEARILIVQAIWDNIAIEQMYYVWTESQKLLRNTLGDLSDTYDWEPYIW